MSRARRKGRLGGAAMMVWLFFANLFEPSKVATTGQIAGDRLRGDEAARRAATAAGRPA